MRAYTFSLLALLVLLWGCAGGGGSDTDVVIPSCSGASILTPDRLGVIRIKFPLFEPELYCGTANIRDTSTFLPSNYTPARFFGRNRPSPDGVTPLGIRFRSNGFDAQDIAFALPTRIDYFDVDGQPFFVDLPMPEDDRQVRVTAAEIDRIFLAVKEQLRTQFPSNPEMQQVSPSSITVTFQASVFYVDTLRVWAGGVTSGNGTSIEVAVFHLSPRVKTPISWRGIPGVSGSWLAHEIRNAIFIQSGHPELAT
ncbi:MAG TPA: hypothetical protein VLB32_02525 [Candidatus Acidoferrales bacterium]|nr:hypothetical protein [Candidatus Acidoferrales bacterium]